MALIEIDGEQLGLAFLKKWVDLSHRNRWYRNRWPIEIDGLQLGLPIKNGWIFRFTY